MSLHLVLPREETMPRAAPGQLDWLDSGCMRAEQFGIQPERVINARSAGQVIGPAG